MSTDLRWTIVSIDPQVDLTIVAQYKPGEGVAVSKQANLSTISTPGTFTPAVQWVSNTVRTVNFAGEFRALDNMDQGPKAAFQKMDRLNLRDSILGRAPRVAFTWGDISIRGYVSKKDIQVVGYFPTGTLKAFTFSLEITEAPSLQLDLASPAPGETQYVMLGGGEIFELLAFQHTGDPLKGELIRRENPSIAGRMEAAGDVIKILEADHPRMQEVVEPVSLPFLGEAWKTVVSDLARSRGTSNDRGMSLSMLPELLSGEVTY